MKVETLKNKYTKQKYHPQVKRDEAAMKMYYEQNDSKQKMYLAFQNY